MKSMVKYNGGVLVQSILGINLQHVAQRYVLI